MYKQFFFVHNFYEEYMDNIINFNDYNKKKNLTDDDIKSLFLGLINLIKTNAQDEANFLYKQKFKENNILLNNAKLELKIKDEIIVELKKENEQLVSKMNLLNEKIKNYYNNSKNLFK